MRSSPWRTSRRQPRAGEEALVAKVNGGAVIIECAINGVTSPEKNANVPRKPAEIVDDAFRALDAGASLIHAHNSDIQLGGEAAAQDYLAAWRPILANRPDTLWYPTLCWGSGAAA